MQTMNNQVIDRFKGCVPTTHLNQQHTDNPAKSSEARFSSLGTKAQGTDETIGLSQSPAPERHSGDRQPAQAGSRLT